MITDENKQSMAKQIYDLQTKTTNELREIFIELFGKEPPALTSARQIRPKIAYRIQELAYGGLPMKTEKKLLELLKDLPNQENAPLMPGSKIIKEYQGQTHEILVQDKSFVYKGIDYKSLSAIAKTITGTNWNGKRFFNVK